MRIYVEKNARLGEGYHVRVMGDEGQTDLIDFHPYTLRKAVLMAKKALDIINQREGANTKLRHVLEIDQKSVIDNREFDDLSWNIASKIDAGQGISYEDGIEDCLDDSDKGT